MFQQLKQRFFKHKSQDEARLTTKEIELIRQTWHVLRSDISRFKVNGADLFIRFFTKYPDYQRQFKSFKDIPITFSQVPLREMRINKRLLAHGTYVMYTIGMLVDNLENPSTLEQMLKRLARNHYRRRVNMVAFEHLRDIFIEQLQEQLGTKVFTKKTAVAWHKAFGYILTALDREFAQLETDTQKMGSYFQLNKAHRLAKRNLIVSLQAQPPLPPQPSRKPEKSPSKLGLLKPFFKLPPS